MIAVMFACLFAGVMYYNIGIDNKVLLYTVSSEITDVSFDLENTTDSAWILKEIQEMEDVNKALYYDFRPVMCDNEYLAVYVTENFDILENNKCYQGRNPIHDNEVALGGGAAQAYNKKLGDTITLKIGDRKEDYLITGLIQSANSGGYDAELTTKAYKKIFPQFKPDYLYVYLEEGTDKDVFIESVLKQYGEFIAASTNFEETYKSQMGVYTVIVSIISIIIVLITSALVALILYLLIKTTIIRRSQEIGIMKTIGYTSHQIMLQISLSFLPVILIGIIVGGSLGGFGMNPLISILFRSIGIMKINFVITIPMILGIGIGLCVFSFAVCILVSMKIRKIAAYHLINE
jgi:putative ABC transport system permease protein